MQTRCSSSRCWMRSSISRRRSPWSPVSCRSLLPLFLSRLRQFCFERGGALLQSAHVCGTERNSLSTPPDFLEQYPGLPASVRNSATSSATCSRRAFSARGGFAQNAQRAELSASASATLNSLWCDEGRGRTESLLQPRFRRAGGGVATVAQLFRAYLPPFERDRRTPRVRCLKTCSPDIIKCFSANAVDVAASMFEADTRLSGGQFFDLLRHARKERVNRRASHQALMARSGAPREISRNPAAPKFRRSICHLQQGARVCFHRMVLGHMTADHSGRARDISRGRPGMRPDAPGYLRASCSGRTKATVSAGSVSYQAAG